MSAQLAMVLLPITVFAVGLAAILMAYVSSVRTPIEQTEPSDRTGPLTPPAGYLLPENEREAATLARRTERRPRDEQTRAAASENV